MPIIFTNQFKSEEVSSNEVEVETIPEAIQEEKFDYGMYSNIRLLHVDSGEIENVDLDNYLYGVVASEMPANFELEALKANPSQNTEIEKTNEKLTKEVEKLTKANEELTKTNEELTKQNTELTEENKKLAKK